MGGISLVTPRSGGPPGPGPRPRRRAAVIALCALAVAALGGCGLGPGSTPGGVSLTVTEGFGQRAVQQAGAPKVVGQETVMQLLMRNDHVGTRYGGGFVQSIDGHSGGQQAGQPVDWFYYVNGVEAGKGAADTTLHQGDHVWFDLHDWAATQSIPAVVGSFPEPFRHGIGGNRYPVTVYCTAPSSGACKTVGARLRAVGVPVAFGALGTDEPDTLRVLVGPFKALSVDAAAGNLQAGPQVSGVYARFARGGQALTLLNPAGGSARTLTGAGLVAATRLPAEAPTWLVTGTDAAATAAAARSLDASALRDHFALALTGGSSIPLPLGGP